MTQLYAASELVQDDIEEIEKYLSLDTHTSTYEDFGGFKLLTVNKIATTEESLHFEPEVFLLLRSMVYQYKKAEKKFKKLPKGIASLCNFLDKMYVSNQKVLAAYSDEIERLEEGLFERNIYRNFMDTWFRLKKDLARIENYYYRQSIIWKEFISSGEDKKDSFAEHFKDIKDSIAFQNSNLNTLKSRLDGVHHYHDAIKHDKASHAFMVLTIISSIFLPLNLIVGFFGMNTGGLYFSSSPDGTEKVILILLIVILLVVLGQRIVRLVDIYLLRYLLGRTNLYKNISNTLAKVELKIPGK